MEEEINKLIQNEKYCDDFQLPSAAFITFKDTKGREKANHYNGGQKLLEQPFKVEAASEPTDIIWENRHYTKW